MSPDIAGRADLSPFYVMDVMRAAQERETAGGEVLHLEVGQPATGAPSSAVAAAKAALDRPETLRYTDALGIGPLRSRIAELYGTRHDLEVDPGRVVITTGASAGCVVAMLAAFDVGARVGVCEPGYPCYRQMLRAFGLEPVPIPIGADTRYQPTPELLSAAGPLDGVVLASPSNPTGSLLTPAELDDIVAWCAANDAWLIADEIYHGITFDRPAPTAAAASSEAIIVNSFSKYFSMTGWRLGWLVVPEKLIRPAELITQNLMISAPTLSQIAACAAFDDLDELDAHVARYAANRDLVVAGLERLGCTDIAPADGAFYAYADVSHLTDDSQQLCRRWLDELGVATTPGIDFDPVRGHRFVRMSYAGETSEVSEALDRLNSSGPVDNSAS